MVERQYQRLKEVLMQTDREAMNVLVREFHRSITSFGPLTLTGLHRTPLDVCVCDPPPMPIVGC